MARRSCAYALELCSRGCRTCRLFRIVPDPTVLLGTQDRAPSRPAWEQEDQCSVIPGLEAAAGVLGRTGSGGELPRAARAQRISSVCLQGSTDPVNLNMVATSQSFESLLGSSVCTQPGANKCGRLSVTDYFLVSGFWDCGTCP